MTICQYTAFQSVPGSLVGGPPLAGGGGPRWGGPTATPGGGGPGNLMPCGDVCETIGGGGSAEWTDPTEPRGYPPDFCPPAVLCNSGIKKGSPYSITERRVPELIPVLGSQPAGGVSHKPGCRLPLLSAGTAVTLATLKRAATNFAAW